MEQISQQLLFQRLRNRVIEVLELHASLEGVVASGTFEVVNIVEDWLPLDYEKAPKVFSEHEKEAITVFLRLSEAFAEAALENKWDKGWLRTSAEWLALSKYSEDALAVFMQRGRFQKKQK